MSAVVEKFPLSPSIFHAGVSALGFPEPKLVRWVLVRPRHRLGADAVDRTGSTLRGSRGRHPRGQPGSATHPKQLPGPGVLGFPRTSGPGTAKEDPPRWVLQLGRKDLGPPILSP